MGKGKREFTGRGRERDIERHRDRGIEEKEREVLRREREVLRREREDIIKDAMGGRIQRERGMEVIG